MIVAIVGGQLQGVEAVYLARKAGWEVILIDKQRAVPAAGLCDSFFQADVSIAVEREELHRFLQNVSMIIPATENLVALKSLYHWSQSIGIPLAFSPDAYAISSSKRESDRLFNELGIPAPQPWPRCSFPVIVKPGNSSGSRGVRLIRTFAELKEMFPGSLPPEGWVIQEYLDGPSYSLEVVGTPGHYTPLQVTDLEMDEQYDCRRVSAPTDLSESQVKEFNDIAVTLAEAVKLVGVMDVEAVLHEEQLKVLEIDARLPSQTPTAVYHSSGCNILQRVVDCFLNENQPQRMISLPSLERNPGVSVIYEHISVSPQALAVCGEHIMADADPLHLHQGFFGADEAITNFTPDRKEWVATLIITAGNPVEAWDKRNTVIKNILARNGNAASQRVGGLKKTVKL